MYISFTQRHTHTPHNSETTIDIRVHVWFTSDTTVLEFTIPNVYSTYTHNTQSAIDVRMHGSQVMHTVCVRSAKLIWHMRTHNTKNTIDMRMHAWFTVDDAHCSSPLYLVYIPTYTYTYHLILQTTTDIRMHT